MHASHAPTPDDFGSSATNARAARSDDAPLEVTIESVGALQSAQGTLLERPLAHWRTLMEQELGVPAGRCVGTGHQAELWHPGILAKFLWADALAAQSQAARIWLLVDTDLRDPLELRLPVRTAGGLRAVAHRFGAAMPHGTAACARSATTPTPLRADLGPLVPPSADEGVRALQAALERAATATDAAAQCFRALTELCGGLFDAAPVVRTSQLLRTTLGAALIERALADPAACVRAFNAAATLVPRVAKPLGAHPRDGIELPFWTVRSDGLRMRLYEGTLREAHERGAPIWPRAFLTGAIARAALCDRFVHGTGGRLYERATERFFELWIGAVLPAFDTATATMPLVFPADSAVATDGASGTPMVTAETLRAHWFDPEGSARSEGPSAFKQRHLAAIAELPRKSPQRRAAFRAMHSEFARLRAEHADRFASLSERAVADRHRAQEAQLRADRTWAVPLHSQQRLRALARAVRAHAVAGGDHTPPLEPLELPPSASGSGR